MNASPFHVVQIARADPPAVELIKSFADRSEAVSAAEAAQQSDLTGHFDYQVTEDPADSEDGVDDPASREEPMQLI